MDFRTEDDAGSSPGVESLFYGLLKVLNILNFANSPRAREGKEYAEFAEAVKKERTARGKTGGIEQLALEERAALALFGRRGDCQANRRGLLRASERGDGRDAVAPHDASQDG